MRLIDTMLQETAEGTDGINYFALAPRPYANLEDGPGRPAFPRIWVYSTGPRDTIAMNHTVTTQYNVLMEISDLCPLSATPEQLQETWDRVQLLWIKFINRLSSHAANVMPIGKVTREEIAHRFDQNVCGYLCQFTITPLDTPVYQCP